MKNTLIILVLCVVLTAPILLTGGTAVNAGPLALPSSGLASLPNGTVLAAGDVIDLAWDPAGYPVPSQAFLRWELFRGTLRSTCAMHRLVIIYVVKPKAYIPILKN